MGLRDTVTVKYAVICSGILYLIIAVLECTPPITTPNYKFVLGVQVQCNLY